MSYAEAIVLGIAQGLTEFLPISSTAHLRIVPAFVGWPDPGAAFTAVVQLGTLAAVLIYFRRDLARIVVAWLAGLRSAERRRDFDSRMGWYLIIATVPIVIFGAAFSDSIEKGARNLYLIGSTLIALGLVLLIADRIGSKRRPFESIRPKDGVIVGLAQALALIPGVSRSGATISAGLFRGLDRQAAARFAFLLSIPAVLLSGLYELRHFLEGGHRAIGTPQLIVASGLAFVVGYISIAFLLRYLARHSLLPFVIYRVVLGAVVLGLTAAGTIH
jgi:undecaprenyl-diphosphatase